MQVGELGSFLVLLNCLLYMFLLLWYVRGLFCTLLFVSNSHIFCTFKYLSVMLPGKLPNNLVHERYRKRYNRESFIYSVRFRVGPFGITFDNKVGYLLQIGLDFMSFFSS